MVVEKAIDVRSIKKRHLFCCCIFGFLCGAGAIVGLAVYLGLRFKDILNDVGNLNTTFYERTTSKTACRGLNWSIHNGNCYFFGNYTIPWRNAQSTCVTLSSHLVDVYSKEEAEWLSNTAKVHKNNDFWIGGIRNSTTLNFQWYNNGQIKRINFTYWIQGQSNDQEQNCIQTSKLENHKWKTDSCSNKKQFICKQKISRTLGFLGNFVR